jgi:Zn-dependent peptidase ImmA (M78 family)
LLTKHSVTSLPTPLEKLVAAEGLQIVPMSWGRQHSLGGLFLRKEAMIFVNADHPPRRRRFSLAHELGHYALFHDYLKEGAAGIDLDHPPESGAALHHDATWESEANIFANELLVPRVLLEQYRSRPPRDDGGEPPFNNPFSVLARPKSQQLSERDLAELFDVSDEVMFIALKEHRLL